NDYGNCFEEWRPWRRLAHFRRPFHNCGRRDFSARKPRYLGHPLFLPMGVADYADRRWHQTNRAWKGGAMSRCYNNGGRVTGHMAFGIFLLVVGVLSLLNNLNIINIPPLTRLIFPALLIWVGLNLVMRQRPARVESREAPYPDDLNVSTMFGGVN